MDDFEFNNQMEEQKQLSRIKWLHVVLVLSIIGSGLNLFSSLMMALFAPTLMQTFESMSPDLPQEMSIMYETVFNTPRIMYVCLSVLYAMSLAGVLLMWRLRKNGFHLYTLAQLLILVVPVLFMGRSFIAMGDIMLTLLFVLYYFISLKSIGAFQMTDENASNLPEKESFDEQNEQDDDEDD